MHALPIALTVCNTRPWAPTDWLGLVWWVKQGRLELDIRVAVTDFGPKTRGLLWGSFPGQMSRASHRVCALGLCFGPTLTSQALHQSWGFFWPPLQPGRRPRRRLGSGTCSLCNHSPNCLLKGEDKLQSRARRGGEWDGQRRRGFDLTDPYPHTGLAARRVVWRAWLIIAIYNE